MRRVLSVAVLLTLSAALAGPVLASTPGNDTYAGRTAITALPFSESIDTTEATTDADDVALNESCRFPGTAASVWYEFTAAADADHIISAAGGSDYAIGLIVAVGEPGRFEVLACGDKAIEHFGARAGQTYTVLAADIGVDDPPLGGLLVMTIEEETPPPPPPPAPTVSLVVDASGHVDRATGVATIAGSLSCSVGAQFAFLEVELLSVPTLQSVGFSFDFGEGIVCDGTEQRWAMDVYPYSSPFRVGPVYARVMATACAERCATVTQGRFVLLQR